jgi:SNF2 family DNA or RNA helicase
VEDQAIDRVHRLGQTRETVHILRFKVKDTVEDQMLVVQEKKARVARNALACAGIGDKDGKEGRLSLDDLRRFF